MGKYFAGPSVLRLPGRPAIVPGEYFEHVFEEAHETMALVSGAVRLSAGETSMAEQRAATEAAAAAALIDSDVPLGDAVTADNQGAESAAAPAPEQPSAPASRRRIPTKAKE